MLSQRPTSSLLFIIYIMLSQTETNLLLLVYHLHKVIKHRPTSSLLFIIYIMLSQKQTNVLIVAQPPYCKPPPGLVTGNGQVLSAMYSKFYLCFAFVTSWRVKHYGNIEGSSGQAWCGKIWTRRWQSKTNSKSDGNWYHGSLLNVLERKYTHTGMSRVQGW
jgi:hypothetical protein